MCPFFCTAAVVPVCEWTKGNQQGRTDAPKANVDGAKVGQTSPTHQSLGCMTGERKVGRRRKSVQGIAPALCAQERSRPRPPRTTPIDDVVKKPHPFDERGKSRSFRKGPCCTNRALPNSIPAIHINQWLHITHLREVCLFVLENGRRDGGTSSFFSVSILEYAVRTFKMHSS